MDSKRGIKMDKEKIEFLFEQMDLLDLFETLELLTIQIKKDLEYEKRNKQ